MGSDICRGRVGVNQLVELHRAGGIPGVLTEGRDGVVLVDGDTGETDIDLGPVVGFGRANVLGSGRHPAVLDREIEVRSDPLAHGAGEIDGPVPSESLVVE